MYCGKCGSYIADGQSFCGSCGAPAPNITPKQPKSQPFAQPIQPVFQKPVAQQQSFQQPAVQQPITQQPANPQPVYYQTVTQAPKKSNVSVLALIFAIAGLLLCAVNVLNILIAITAIVLSIIGLAIKNSDKVRSGVALGLAIVAFSLGCVFISPNARKSENTASQSSASAVINSESQQDETTSMTSSSETQLPFAVADDSNKMNVGEIAKSGNSYFGLANVRSLGEVQTAIKDYSVNISDSQEVIYPIIEVYNCSDKAQTYNTGNISVYADSIKGSDPDTIYLVGVDNIKQLHSYEVDPNKTALIIDAFVVDKGWSELTIYYGDISWTLTPEDINHEAYSFSTLFNLSSNYSFTEPGTKIYSEKFELVFDGTEMYKNSFIKEDYVIFEFTINNTSEEKLDLSNVGHEMKAYWNNQLLDSATYTLNDNINGYSNVFDVDEIHAGMTAKVYVAVEVQDTTGVFECYFDIGYIKNERIGYVCCKIE